MTLFKYPNERGQGLVEYALILVLVAVVAIGVLRILGPVVGGVYGQVMGALGYSAITDVSPARTGNGHGNDVVVDITVSTATSVTVTDSQSGQSVTSSCSDSCTVTLSGVGYAAGTVTVRADAGGIYSAPYPAKL